MPSLPRIRARSLGTREVVEPTPRQPAELTANGLTWIHLDSPTADESTALAERFGWHPLDIEDVLSKRQRPKLDAIEDDIEEERSQDLVRDISRVKQEIISYRKIIKPQRPTLRLLERHVERFLPEDLELYFDDLVDASERIWDILDNYKEIVEALEATNESAIQHRQNDVLRLLTVFSAVLLPLTLIASIFGMNVEFPGEGTAGAFWVMVVTMVAVFSALVAFFRWRRWI